MRSAQQDLFRHGESTNYQHLTHFNTKEQIEWRRSHSWAGGSVFESLLSRNPVVSTVKIEIKRREWKLKIRSEIVQVIGSSPGQSVSILRN